MKELYTKPVVEVEEFETADVVTTSINIGGGVIDD